MVKSGPEKTNSYPLTMKAISHSKVLRGVGTSTFLAICAAFLHSGLKTCPAQTREVAAAYVEGVEALESGDFKKAEEDFAKATAADDENADYLRARGVAGVLAESFPAAITGLERVLRLRQDDSEARLWLAAAYRMSGDPARGAQLFSFNGVPHDYADMIYNVMAMDYWSSRTSGSYYDREQQQQVSVKTPVKKLFPEAAKAYAERHKATGPGANQVVLARMKAALDRGDWTTAWNDLVVLRRTVPDDVPLRSDAAKCLLGFGDALHAREEFTHVLCLMPLWGEGYLARARAAAMIGDLRRAQADLDTASALHVKTDEGRANLRKLAATSPADDAVDKFFRVVLTDSSWEDSVTAALALHRWFNQRRLRYDEAYQDRLWAMNDAIRADAKNADRLEVLGRFMFNHHVVPSVWNGPRASQPLRPQSKVERDAELHRAVASCDAALTMVPRHGNALTTKALLFHTLGRVGEAESLADQAMAIEPRNVRALGLKARILLDRAGQLAAQAAALRAGRTETRREQRNDGIYEITTRHPPTPAQLAEAARYEAEAAACRKKAAPLQTEADRVRREVVPALLAKRAVQEAASIDPDRDDVNRALAEAARARGDARAQKVFALLAEPLQHTTAAPHLKTAWDHIMHTAWKSAEESLALAAQADPADARVDAYRSVIAAGRQEAAGALSQGTAALALEEARARLMGTSFVATNQTPLRPSEAGLAVITRQRQGEALTAAGRNDRALGAFAANLSIEPRAAKDDLWDLLPMAMLPDPAGELNAIPEAPSLASLMAWSRLGAARALLALGREEEAQQEFRTIRARLAKWPATAQHRESMNAVDAWARLGLAEAAVVATNYDEAFRLLMSGEGWPGNLPKDLEALKKSLTDKFMAARKQVEEDRMAAESRLTPQQMRERRQRDDADQFQKQRDGIAKELQDPNLRPADRRALEASLAELDRVIAARKNGGRRR